MDWRFPGVPGRILIPQIPHPSKYLTEGEFGVSIRLCFSWGGSKNHTFSLSVFGCLGYDTDPKQCTHCSRDSKFPYRVQSWCLDVKGTADGRHPAPPGLYKTLYRMGFLHSFTISLVGRIFSINRIINSISRVSFWDYLFSRIFFCQNLQVHHWDWNSSCLCQTNEAGWTRG